MLVSYIEHTDYGDLLYSAFLYCGHNSAVVVVILHVSFIRYHLLLIFISLVILYIGPTAATAPGPAPAASNVVTSMDPPPLISHFYEWNRKLFLTPDLGYDPYEDPLSREGQARVYRDNQLVAVLDMQQDLTFLFRNVDKQEFFLETGSNNNINNSGSGMNNNNNNSTVGFMMNRNTASTLSAGECIAHM